MSQISHHGEKSSELCNLGWEIVPLLPDGMDYQGPPFLSGICISTCRRAVPRAISNVDQMSTRCEPGYRVVDDPM